MAAKELRLVAMNAIDQERNLQDLKWGEQNHDLTKWVSILGEEYGEFCQEVNRHTFDPDPDARKKHVVNVYREATQVAAVAAAILECIDRNEWMA